MSVSAGQLLIAGMFPRQLIARTKVTSDSASFTTTETVGASVTGDLVVAHTYLVYAYFKINYTGGTTESAMQQRIRLDDENGELLQVQLQQTSDNTGSTGIGYSIEVEYDAEESGEKTFALTGQRNKGDATLNFAAGLGDPWYMRIEYLGKTSEL